MSGFFLFSGFVFSFLGHLIGWVLIHITNQNHNTNREQDLLIFLLLFLTGVSVNAFGYLLFR